MRMQIEEYNTIMGVIRTHKGLSMDLYENLRVKFPTVDERALFSMHAMEYQQRMKVNHVKTPVVMNKYYSQYMEAIDKQESPGIIVRIAKEADVCPCLVAKLILQKHFTLFSNDLKSQSPANINLYLRDTTMIEDKDLAYEIYLCTIYDDVYSPIVDSVKSSLGQQYEIQLYRQLTDLGVAFRDEEQLRKFGYDKTPDIKLEVPIAVDGAIVHWIESKALFGDEEVHKEYIKNQYSSYWNRFGPGLVIYWFGFLETIENPEDKRFIIRESVPTNILHIIPPKKKPPVVPEPVSEENNPSLTFSDMIERHARRIEKASSEKEEGHNPQTQGDIVKDKLKSLLQQLQGGKEDVSDSIYSAVMLGKMNRLGLNTSEDVETYRRHLARLNVNRFC